MSQMANSPHNPVSGKVPTRIEVEKFHTNADTDGDEGSLHHTLGPRKGQVAGGDHDHRGGNSVALLGDMTISGATVNDAVHSIIAILVDLGAKDNTTF